MNAQNFSEAHDLARYLIGKYAGKARQILEVGCGSGAMLREMTQTLKASGCGIDPFVFESGEESVCFKPLKAQELTLLGRRFDLVYTVHSLHHFEKIPQFLRALEKALSWPGVFVLVDWKKGAQTGIPERYFSLKEITGLMKDFNFKLLEIGEAGDNFYLVATLRQRCLAVATDEQGKEIFPKMFGQAPFFDLYLLEDGRFRFLQKRKNIYQKTMQHEKTLDVYGEVPECQALLARRIGRQGQQRLREKGVHMFFEEGSVNAALEKIAKLTEL